MSITSSGPLCYEPTQAETLNKLMVEAIRQRHPPAEWLLFFELRGGTGYKRDSASVMDAFAMHQWPSYHLRRVAYEIKVSRGDFLRELKQPRKRRVALKFSNRFWFITPPGVAKPEEIPPLCGLMEVPLGPGEPCVVVEAPERDSCPPTWLFVASMCRAIRDGSRGNGMGFVEPKP